MTRLLILLLVGGCAAPQKVSMVAAMKRTPKPYPVAMMQRDFKLFAECLGGPDKGIKPWKGESHHKSFGVWGCPDKARMCKSYDVDGNDSVDLRDWAILCSR